MGNKKKRKWAVFFIIKAAGKESMREVIQMVNEIRSIPINNQVSVVLCINFTRAHLDELLAGNETLPDKSSEELTTIFFKLVKNNAKDSPFRTSLDIIDEKPKFDITNPRWLKRYFRNIVLLPNEASKYLLITWDHGRFYGIFEDKAVNGANNGPGNLSETVIDSRGLKKNADRVVLTMKELADAIKWAFGRKSIDVMLMMNCFMQSLDAGYALRKSVDYLVAPQGLIDLDGYNYPLIFHVLMHKPDISPVDLAKLAVTSFPSKVYPDGHLSGLRKKRITALFAADLQSYTLFVEMIDSLVEALLKRMPEQTIVEVAKDRSQVDVNTYDFFSFISYLESKDIFIKDSLAASLVLSLREVVMIESFIGNGNPIIGPDDVINNPSGFAVFIPNDIPPANEDPVEEDDPFRTEFYLQTKWHLFIEKLLGHTRTITAANFT